MNRFGNPLRSLSDGWRWVYRVVAAPWRRLARGRPVALVAGVGIALIAVVLAVTFAFALGGDGGETQLVGATPGATATVERVSAGLLEEEEEPASTLSDEDLEGRGRTGVQLPAGEAPAPTGRLVISRIGVNAPLTVRAVGSDGVMRNPRGPEDVALYDFSAFGGLGGWPGIGGNTVLSGHVDYVNVGPAVFWRLGDLQPGDEIELHLDDGSIIKYTVRWNRTVDDASSDWNSIVAATSQESVTLITCTGNFDPATLSYDARRVVWAVRTS